MPAHGRTRGAEWRHLHKLLFMVLLNVVVGPGSITATAKYYDKCVSRDDPQADRTAKSAQLCTRVFKQYPGCTGYATRNDKAFAEDKVYADSDLNNFLAHIGKPDLFDCSNSTAENLASLEWRTFCRPSRSCYCYARTQGSLDQNYADFEIEVDCSNQGLSSIPLGLPPDTHALFLQGNNLTHVSLSSIVAALGTNMSRPYTSATDTQTLLNRVPSQGLPLKRLHLHNNPLGSIEDDTFLATPSLEELLVHHTELVDLRKRQLHGLQGSLKTLWAQGSSISTIEHGTFANFSKLKSLWLYGNPVTDHVHAHSMRNGFFSGLDKIEEIRFQNLLAIKPVHKDHSNFSCCNLLGLEDKKSAKIYVGGVGTVGYHQEFFQERKGSVYCGSGGECGHHHRHRDDSCSNQFDGCYKFDRWSDVYQYTYIVSSGWRSLADRRSLFVALVVTLVCSAQVWNPRHW